MIPSVFPMQVGPANGPDAAGSPSFFSLSQAPNPGTDPSVGQMPAGATGSANGQTPSTEAFLHVLDMLLSASTLPQSGNTSVSNLLVQTSVTTSPTDAPKPTSKESEDPVQASLDPSLCAQIASLLQGLGFQVRPEQIAQLGPMDQQQLDSALEFVSRNLQKGTDPSQVSECAALLLPRPWPLDDLTGAPTSSAAAIQDKVSMALPTGFAQSLDQVLARLHAAVAAAQTPVEAPSQATSPSVDQGIPTAGTRAEPVRLALFAAAVPPATVAAKSEAPSKPQDLVATSPVSNLGKAVATALPSAVTAPSVLPDDSGTSSDPALQVLQGLQQGTAAKDGTGLVATDIQTRHLPPGGTASEFIGRQVLEKVQVQLSEGKRELSLRLWPEELGEVRLSLRMTEDDKVHGRMVVENDSVRQAMLDSMPQLRDALTRHGMDLEKMTVSVEQRDAGSAGYGRDDRGDRDGGARRGADRGGFRDEEMSVAVPMTMGRDTGRRNGFNTIDLWS